MVFQNLFEATYKSFSMATPNSSHAWVLALATAIVALCLIQLFFQLEIIPYCRCPPGLGIATTTGIDHFAAQHRCAASMMEVVNMVHLDSMVEHG